MMRRLSVFILAAASSSAAFEAEILACDTLRNKALSCDAWAANASLSTGDLTEACNTEWGKKNCAQTCCASQETERHVVRRSLNSVRCDKDDPNAADRFKPCYDSMCCKDGGFGCFKRTEHSFALCRPLGGPPEACVSTDTWTCPGRWSRPEAPKAAPLGALLSKCAGKGAGKFKPCITDKCCEDAGFGCFKKNGAAFAQCRPLGGPLAACKSTDSWTCPLDWKTAEEAASKTLDAFGEKISHKHGTCPRGGFAGFAKFSNCWTGNDNCCESGAFGCFQKRGRAYAQCRPLLGHYEDCKDSEDWICPGNWEKREDQPDQPEQPHSLAKPSPASKAHPSHDSTPARTGTESDSKLWFYLFIVLLVVCVGYIGFDLYRKGVCGGGGDGGSSSTQMSTGKVCESIAGSSTGKKTKVVKKAGSAAGSSLSNASGTGKKKVAKKKKNPPGEGAGLPKEEHYWKQEDTSLVDGGSSDEEKK